MNHGTDVPAYGLWSLVVINSAIFILFAFSFFKPKSKRDWRTFGTFSAFLVALFVEMYGFPLTIYVLSGWLTRRFPGIDPLGHDVGHLWYTLLGLKGNPHLNPMHIASNLIIVAGFVLLSGAWRVLYRAQQEGTLARTGPYAHIRHPQYMAFIVIMFGFLLQWPTFVTVVMFPVLVTVYVNLARREEREVRNRFGLAWDEYAARTPAFFPRLRGAGRQEHAHA
ncbi:MAG TPA: isoprenylcysteine carboxylmethyltransferase family protein [Gemmatimonadales bacterium]|nr:isoprenylcysteine carboxylmethyltransferase family protein [Gemmatimonadales bacterium]